MSSVSAEAFPAKVGVEFRIKRADDHLTVRSVADDSAAYAAHASTSHAGAPARRSSSVDQTVDPTIIFLIHSASGAETAASESLDRIRTTSPEGETLGFTRVIPESALSAVREAYAQFRRQFGQAGNVTALAVEKIRQPLSSVVAHDPADPRNLTSLEFEELSIDPARREVWVEGSLVGLTKSEFDLLYVLAQRPGVVYSRRQIVLAYKGADYPVDDRSIDVQMFNLRRKIRSAGIVLQTIRGVGYRFTGKPLA